MEDTKDMGVKVRLDEITPPAEEEHSEAALFMKALCISINKMLDESNG